MDSGKLKDKDHKAMCAMLTSALEAFKEGTIGLDAAVGGLAHVMAALDKGNTEEAVSWFNQDGVTYFQQ